MMEELFLKILNMSITATYVLLAVLFLRLILKRTPKWISYALWSLVLFRLVCPVSISSAFSVFGRIGKTASTGGGLEHIPENIGMMSVPQVDIGTTSINSVINNALPAAAPTASANPMQIFIFIGACVWLAGIAIMLIYSVVSYLRLKRHMMDATLLTGNIFETDKKTSPFVCGLVKPKIYLPIGLSDNERDYVLRHEQTHIGRKDHLIKPFAFFVLSVHWFNPFMWLAFILMSRDLEMSCDEKVVSGLDSESKVGYSSALIQLAIKRPILAGSPLAFGESVAKGRIKNILNYKKPTFWALIVAAAVVIVSTVCLLTNPAKTLPDLTTPNTISPFAPAYAFDENLYTNPLSSYMALGGTGQLYLFDSDKGFSITPQQQIFNYIARRMDSAYAQYYTDMHYKMDGYEETINGSDYTGTFLWTQYFTSYTYFDIPSDIGKEQQANYMFKATAKISADGTFDLHSIVVLADTSAVGPPQYTQLLDDFFKNLPSVDIRIDLATDELLNKYDSYNEFIEFKDEDYQRIVITPYIELKNFKFIEIGYDESENKVKYFEKNVLYSIDKLLPQKPFVVTWMEWGSIPHRGISFVDENNKTRSFYIAQSGKDGALLLLEF
jgi:beta-lactamase regulating signal transducer with metallopeptidase domain